MNRQVKYLVLLIIAYTQTTFAQSDADILQFSYWQNTGTARNIAVGNTMGVVGADISNINTNPAGIGKLSSTEGSITLGVPILNATTEYLDNKRDDSKLGFQVNNIGVVFSSKYLNDKTESSKWNGIKFGLSYNRLATFNQNYYMSGYNANNSLIDNHYEIIFDNANTLYDVENNFPFDASLSYGTDLLYYDSVSQQIYSSVNAFVQQDITLKRKGSLNEAAVAIASGYNNKIFVGASLGMPVLNYTQNIIHHEEDVFDSSYNFNYFDYESSYNVSGVGVNFQLGLLAQINKNFRVGFSFKTPSVIFAKDKYNAYEYVDYEDYIAEAESPDGLVSYNIRLPWRMSVGGSYLHKYGFVAVEYELSDAGNAKYNFKDDGFNDYEADLNDGIGEKYKLYHNIKIGIEGKFDPIRIRAGVQYKTSPFNTEVVEDKYKQNQLIYSAGLGFRKEHFYIDAAYQFVKSRGYFTPYVLNDNSQPTATLNDKNSLISLTAGFKF
ncbi:MAG: hypothetical protein H6553_01780 [Chitinophagales bacterium]|nr:hypothetical protein [Chitinophagales bacterium]